MLLKRWLLVISLLLLTCSCSSNWPYYYNGYGDTIAYQTPLPGYVVVKKSGLVETGKQIDELQREVSDKTEMLDKCFREYQKLKEGK
jgi:hypothetical protein